MRLYNTATRKLDELPAPPGPIRMYFCGPTVYQRIHVGNARPFIVSMWLKRWLEHQGYDVTLVENITDINDKIYAAAPGNSAQFAADASEWYIEDTGDLGLGRPDHEPKATETVPEIVALIEELIQLDLAYPAGGDVYFRVDRYPEYGVLSGRLDEDSARNPSEEEEQSSLKESPRDFALWKGHKEGEDTSWESPWGAGRPGWHIECSAMAEKHLGPVFEIHGGGLDLVFPHHENEIAQSRGAGREFAQLWMHNGILRFGGEKMSKSLGNVITLRDALGEWGPETLLMLFLGAHWRKPMDYTDETLAAAKARADGLREVFRNPSEPGGSWGELAAALDDDFNTPEALAVMHDWRDHDLLRRGLELFGLGSLAEQEEAPAELDELAQRRATARADGDFHEADRLRKEIEAGGWEVRDVAGDSGYRLVPKA
ncbi:MAG: cysteine--tRNA ligase [Actinobacteria bacterium]|jgi:cysteinyl-tRNA synthetase|nr:MAG: cysteine--tRNA ligase [Actinomycetota bacterium]